MKKTHGRKEVSVVMASRRDKGKSPRTWNGEEGRERPKLGSSRGMTCLIQKRGDAVTVQDKG